MRRVLILCGFVALFAASSAWSATKPPAAPVCSKIVTTATLNSLTGGSFIAAKLQSPSTASSCAWNDPANDVKNPYAADISLNFTVGTAVAKQWKLYSNPPRVSDAITPVSGIGTKAVEVNDYIAVVKGTTFFQLWAGNNGGPHLTYPQLETVAKYVVSKIK